MEMITAEHEGNWTGISDSLSITCVRGWITPYRHCLATGDCTALTLEEKQGLRSAFGGSATFAVQCIAVESGLGITVSKEAQYIVQGFWGVFSFLLPLQAGLLGRLECLPPKSKADFFSSQQTSGLYPCNAGQCRSKAEETAPCLERSAFKNEVWQVCVAVDGNRIGLKSENNSGRWWASN